MYSHALHVGKDSYFDIDSSKAAKLAENDRRNQERNRAEQESRLNLSLGNPSGSPGSTTSSSMSFNISSSLNEIRNKAYHATKNNGEVRPACWTDKKRDLVLSLTLTLIRIVGEHS